MSQIRIWGTAFILFASTFLLLTVRPTALFAASSVSTFTSSEDAFVKSSTPTTNFGSATDLEVQNDSRVMHSLVRFTVGGLPADAVVSSAVFQLYVPSNGSATGGDISQVGGSWTETGVTWANAPPVGAKIAAMPNPVKSGAWSQVALPPGFITGNGTYDLYVTTPNTTDAVYYASNNAATKPTLVVTWDASGATPTPTLAPTPTVVPTATPTPAPITPTPTQVPGATPTPTPSLIPSPTPTLVPTATPTMLPTPTPTPNAGDPVIVAAGDIGCKLGTSCHAQAVYSLIPPVAPQGVLTLGDTQYYCGSATAFNQVYNPSWGQVKAITHPAVGNHEYLTSGASDCTSANAGAAGYYGYFGAAAGAPSQGYYSYDIGTWHFIALNTQCSVAGGCGTTSPQYKWLQSDLAAHPNACTLAYYHIPLYSVGGRASKNSQPLYNLMYQNGVDVILTGHDHIYERYVPQDANGNAIANGITEFVVGTGGSDHTSIVSTSNNLVTANAKTFGILKMTLHPTSADYAFIPDTTSGTYTDSGTITCH